VPTVVQLVQDCKPTIQLRSYQEEPAQRILEALSYVNEKFERATVLAVAPVGFGKTVLFSYIAAEYVKRGAKVLVLAHRQELLDQIIEKTSLFGLTTGLEKAESRVDEASLPDVTVASVQTLQRARLTRFEPGAFGLIVIDEAHHAVTDAYKNIVSRFFAAPVLGVTGTPERLDGEGLGVTFDHAPVVISLDEGIRAGWLSKPRLRTYTIDGYNLDSVKTVAGEFDAGDLERELLADPVLHAATHILREVCPGRRTLVFTPTVKTAERLAETLVSKGMPAIAVSGSMGKQERAEATKRYRSGEVPIAINCMLWTEGFDVPETDCVVLLRPTKSSALLTQMVGRGLRISEGKNECLLVEIQAGTVKGKMFMSPNRILENVPALTQEKGGKFDSDGKMDEPEPELPRIVDSIETRASMKERGYDELVGNHNAVPEADRPTEAQLYAVKNLGFDPKKVLTKADVQKCFDIVNDRRRKGLCSVKIGKKLQGYGFNGNISEALGALAMTMLANNKWRPPPQMYKDHRFTR
jgi:superfamily II DNA or RNA helicase